MKPDVSTSAVSMFPYPMMACFGNGFIPTVAAVLTGNSRNGEAAGNVYTFHFRHRLGQTAEPDPNMPLPAD